MQLPLWDLRHSDLDILNARIFIPDCDPVVFTGRMSAGQIKGNLYAKSVDVHAASRFWAIEDIKKNLQGFISNIDVAIQGPCFHLGQRLFFSGRIRYKSVLLTDGFSS